MGRRPLSVPPPTRERSRLLPVLHTTSAMSRVEEVDHVEMTSGEGKEEVAQLNGSGTLWLFGTRTASAAAAMIERYYIIFTEAIHGKRWQVSRPVFFALENAERDPMSPTSPLPWRAVVGALACCGRRLYVCVGFRISASAAVHCCGGR